MTAARSGEPGAYDRTGSFVGGGTRRFPLNAVIDPMDGIGWSVALAAFVSAALVRAPRGGFTAGADIIRRGEGSDPQITRIFKIPEARKRSNMKQSFVDSLSGSGMSSAKFVAPLLFVLAAGCESSPIEWRGLAERLAVDPTSDETASADVARLVFDPTGAPALGGVARHAPSPAAGDPLACEGSVRTAAAAGTEVYGVWWSRRGDGTAVLRAARSDDAGLTWSSPVAVDTTDRWAVACARPAPAIVADSISKYVHVTYFLHGPDGPGVFFSHSMDRGALFHAPVPILYGERPAETAVAAADSVVVVAFEDPNSKRPQVALAVSRSWGHMFARERPRASSLESPAARPLIALRDSLVAVAWRGPDRSLVARVGTLARP